jgi:hypothetical protein
MAANATYARKRQRAKNRALEILAETHQSEYRALVDEERAKLGLPPTRWRRS